MLNFSLTKRNLPRCRIRELCKWIQNLKSSIQFKSHRLERALRAFSCLTKGGTIAIKHGQQQFYLDIIETKPGNAITIIDTDVNVDFAPPKDYKEVKKVAPLKKEREVKKASEDSKDTKLVWGASTGSKNSSSSYFKKLSGGNTLSGRKPKKSNLIKAASGKQTASWGSASKKSTGGWGAAANKKKGYKAFGGKGYSLK
mmetsp:Transcript_18646/g.27891  ORF Transcript_18646/g.27891 Transcript_18646/m.27891 type:complete len:199 (-) Transcript_18646:133-729(-)